MKTEEGVAKPRLESEAGAMPWRPCNPLKDFGCYLKRNTKHLENAEYKYVDACLVSGLILMSIFVMYKILTQALQGDWIGEEHTWVNIPGKRFLLTVVPQFSRGIRGLISTASDRNPRSNQPKEIYWIMLTEKSRGNVSIRHDQIQNWNCLCWNSVSLFLELDLFFVLTSCFSCTFS